MTRRLAVLALVVAVCTACDDGASKPAPPAQGAPQQAPPAADVTPVFEECAAKSGISFAMQFIPTEQGERFKINLYDHGTGVAVGDYDGDGRDDVFFVNQLGSNALCHNEGGGKFRDVTSAAGADLGLSDRICVAATFGDYDNDGRQDLFVTSTRAGNALFHNEGGGKFRDVTADAGVTLQAHCESGTFFDGDADGDLDLYVTCTGKWTTAAFDEERHYFVGPETLFDIASKPEEKNVYYRNEGNGKFTDATAASGLGAYGWCCECAVFDFDGDGATDVFVSSMFGKSALFRNVGGGKFVDVTETTLGQVPYGAVGVRTLDFDGDGRLDLFVADMHSDMWAEPDLDVSVLDEKKKYPMPYGPNVERGRMSASDARAVADAIRAGNRLPIFGNALYRNLGRGSFSEVSDHAGVETFQPWGPVPADFRNAGLEDVFVPSGMGYPFFVWRNEYLLNRGDGTFVECSAKATLDPPPGGPWLAADVGSKKAARASRGAATADFDGDGRVDLVVMNFNDRPYLYMNRSPARNWVEFRLTGTKANRDAIGAVVTLKAGGRTLVRQVQAAGGYLSQSTKTLHFGLGDATAVESCEVVWPGGGKQTVAAPAVNKIHAVTETPR